MKLPPLQILEENKTTKASHLAAGNDFGSFESSSRYEPIINPQASPFARRDKNLPARAPELFDEFVRRQRGFGRTQSPEPRRSSSPNAASRSPSPLRASRASFGASSTSDALRVPLRVEKPLSLKSNWSGNGDVGQEKHLIVDYVTRAKACRRAGRFEGEAAAFYNIGALYEKQNEDDKAIHYYRKHLAISKQCDDRAGRALACNSIGAVLQRQKRYDEALRFHMAHLSLADLRGKFVAHTNIGVIYDKQNENKLSAEHHQHALRYAIRMASLSAQAIAIANLGVTKTSVGDIDMAKACTERYLQISSDSNDIRSQTSALERLGSIAAEQGNLNVAKQYFQESLRTARLIGDSKQISKVSVLLGVVGGDLLFEKKMKDLRRSLEDKRSQQAERITNQEENDLDSKGKVIDAQDQTEKAD